ncbi:MAG: YhdP family protein [Sedimenticola sp.]
MIRIYHFSARTLKRLLILTIILGGIAVGMGRLLAPAITDYREEIEQWTSQMLGQQVTIGTLKGSWQGAGPKLILHDLALYSKGMDEPQIRFSEVHIAIGLIESLRQGRPAPSTITIHAPKLNITRRQDGTIAVAGLKEVKSQGDSSGAFLLPLRIDVQQGEIIWQDLATNAPPLTLTGVELSLHNDGDRHQLEGSLVLPGKPSGRIQLAADLQGQPGQDDGWSADFYFKGRGLDLTQLLNRRIPEAYYFERGLGDLELWSRWKKSQMTHLEGRVDWRTFTLSRILNGGNEIRSLNFDGVGGAFHWQRQAQGWRIDLADVKLKRFGSTWPKTRFTLVNRWHEQGKRELTAGSSFARLEDLNAIAWLLPAPSPALKDVLLEVLPHGDLHDIRFRFRETDGAPEWSAAGKGRSIMTQPFRGAPGIENLSFNGWMDQNRGTLQLVSENLSLQFPDLFRAPLAINKLNGWLDWQHHSDDSWWLEAKRIEASNHHITTESRLRLRLPDEPKLSAFLDLQTDFHDGDASAVSHYLPTGIMPPGVVEWLDKSVLGGHVIGGSVLFRGALKDFPFEEKPGGRFEVLFAVEDSSLDYLEGWPKLEKLSAKVRFLNGRMDAWADDGYLFDSRIRSLHCEIANLAQGNRLNIKGEVEGAFNNSLRLLRESPLKQDFAPLVEGIEGKGDVRLSLDIAVPLDDSPLKLNGKLLFQDNLLHLGQQDLTLEHADGHLSFDQDHLYTDSLSAELMGSKVQIEVATPKENRLATRIMVNGKIPSQLLAERFSGLSLLQQLDGAADWKLQLDIPHLAAGPYAAVPLVVSSDLVGVTVDLPQPIGKPAQQPQPVRLLLDIGNPQQIPVKVKYGSLLDAALLIDREDPDNPHLLGGNIQLGKSSAKLSQQEGLDIQIKLPELTLDPWLDLLKSEEGSTSPPVIRKLTLELDRLLVKGSEFAPFTLALEDEEEVLKGQVSSNRFQGNIEIPQNLQQKPLRLTLERLDISFEPDNLPEPDNAIEASSIDPTGLPALEAEIKEITVNGNAFGSLQLISQQGSSSWDIKSLTLSSTQLQLTASGRWSQLAEDGQKTEINLAAESPALGQLLEDLGFARNIDDAPALFNSYIQWPDGPLGFRRDQLNGKVSMDITQGTFLNVDPGVGRIFGLLNLGALQRRLTLDFSDVFAKGFGFDRIKGDFTIDNGDAFTTNFTVTGPSATTEIIGRTGLASEDFDQQVSVTPRISSSLTMAGAIAGGPVVGAALYLAEKIMGDSIDKANKIQYRITGPWKKPIVERQKTAPEEENTPRKQTLEASGSTTEETATTQKSTKEGDIKSDKNKTPTIFSRQLDTVKPNKDGAKEENPALGIPGY